jgi:E3 ubiquitin-protein ligase synoviolin
MRLISYAIFSVIAAAIIVVHAYHQRREFFTVVVHLSTSKISVAFLSNAFMAILLCIGSTIQTIFFGKLREAEVERLWDKIKTSLFETCFAVTMFRDDIGSSFLLNFLGLLVLKWFHWLCHFRGEFVSQSIHTSALQHVRALTAMVLLGIVDYYTANALYEAMNEKGINVSLIFAFEILVLFALLVSTSLKYLLYMLCSGWSGLRVSVFYINLGSDLFKIFAYLAFFSVVYSVIGIPLHIVGDVYQTLRSLQKRISDFIRYRAINASINHRFPTVSAEELAQAHDITCIVCQSDMVGGTCKRLPCCRRIVHTECIKSWLEEHATCPLCRFNVMSLPVNAAPAADAAPVVIAAAQNTDALAATQAAAAPAATHAAETRAASSANAPPSHQNAAQSDASHAAAQSNVSTSSVAGTRPYTFNPDYTLSPYRNEVLPANPLSPPPLALLPFPASSLLSPRPAAPMHLHSQLYPPLLFFSPNFLLTPYFFAATAFRPVLPQANHSSCLPPRRPRHQWPCMARSLLPARSRAWIEARN